MRSSAGARPLTVASLLLVTPVLACQASPSAANASPATTSAARHVRVIPAPEFPDAAILIADLGEQARQAQRALLVYVGAPWCEPCRYFHAAAERGELDADFGDLDLLVFDSEHDGARLQAAGYSSRLIPLLALPGANGRASGRSIEGSIKGPGAVAQITPRLKALLGR
jgi:hypothetical protein